MSSRKAHRFSIFEKVTDATQQERTEKAWPRFRPVGTTENSPAIHRCGNSGGWLSSPVGTIERINQEMYFSIVPTGLRGRVREFSRR
jgi:hypothetical protein